MRGVHKGLTSGQHLLCVLSGAHVRSPRDMPDPLKLAALDADDLSVVSAHVQDAVLRSADIVYDPKIGGVVLPLNRFAWETPGTRRWLFKTHERRRAVLHIDRVRGVRAKGVDRRDNKQVLSLLSVTFIPKTEDDPSGLIELIFAGDASMHLEVECVEVRMSDVGGTWETRSKPKHTP
ncbi:MAG: DUF2948 family protein [Pseudomonadota bacterium]